MPVTSARPATYGYGKPLASHTIAIGTETSVSVPVPANAYVCKLSVGGGGPVHYTARRRIGGASASYVTEDDPYPAYLAGLSELVLSARRGASLSLSFYPRKETT